MARTRARNAGHVAAQRLVLHQVDLAGLPQVHDEDSGFDRAFAVNVNVFWTGPAQAEG